MGGFVYGTGCVFVTCAYPETCLYQETQRTGWIAPVVNRMYEIPGPRHIVALGYESAGISLRMCPSPAAWGNKEQGAAPMCFKLVTRVVKVVPAADELLRGGQSYRDALGGY